MLYESISRKRESKRDFLLSNLYKIYKYIKERASEITSAKINEYFEIQIKQLLFIKKQIVIVLF